MGRNVKCDICGKIKEPTYSFKYDDFVFGYTLDFCHGCGEKVRDFIRGLEPSTKKEGKQ